MSPAARAWVIASPGSSRSPPRHGVLAVMAARTPPGRRDKHAVAGRGDDDQLTGPGERCDDLRGVRAAGAAPARDTPRPGAAARDRGVRPDADRHADTRYYSPGL